MYCPDVLIQQNEYIMQTVKLRDRHELGNGLLGLQLYCLYFETNVLLKFARRSETRKAY